MSNVKDRILRFIQRFNISTAEFERIIGVSGGYISNISKSIQPDKLEIISNNFPALNIEWLLIGKGEMIKSYRVSNQTYLHTAPRINPSRHEIYKKNIENMFIQRVKEIIQYLNISNEEFAEKIIVPKDSLINMLEGNTNIEFVILQSILNSLEFISSEWLIAGNGPMLKSEEPTPVVNYSTGRPYYNVDFIGGFDLVLNDQTINPEYNIDFAPYNKEGVLWCNVTGHSMEPEINHGDIIAIKELNDWQTYLPFGEIYGIVTIEHRTIKRVSKSDKEGFRRLIPTNTNQEYAPQDIPLTIVLKVFQVLGSVKRFS